MTHYLNLAEFLVLAEQVTGLDAAILLEPAVPIWPIRRCTRAAGFGDDDFYPQLYDKAAALACRIAWNHPLPDGLKRAAWACLVMFVDLNGGRWPPDPPKVEASVTAMLAVAAREVDEDQFARWLCVAGRSRHRRLSHRLPICWATAWSVTRTGAAAASGGRLGVKGERRESGTGFRRERSGDSQMPERSCRTARRRPPLRGGD